VDFPTCFFVQQQGEQRVRKKCPNFQKISKKSPSRKRPKYYNKAQFENPKHLHQTTFETLKYLQQTMFWSCLFRWKWNKFASTKVAQKGTISLGYFMFSITRNPPNFQKLPNSKNGVNRKTGVKVQCLNYFDYFICFWREQDFWDFFLFWREIRFQTNFRSSCVSIMSIKS